MGKKRMYRRTIQHPLHGFVWSVRRTGLSEITTSWAASAVKARDYRTDGSLNTALINLREAGYVNLNVCIGQ